MGSVCATEQTVAKADEPPDDVRIPIEGADILSSPQALSIMSDFSKQDIENMVSSERATYQARQEKPVQELDGDVANEAAESARLVAKECPQAESELDSKQTEKTDAMRKQDEQTKKLEAKSRESAKTKFKREKERQKQAEADKPRHKIIGNANLNILIGTSRMIAEDSTLIRRIAKFSGKSDCDVRSRLSMGDAGNRGANRLMHVAFLNGAAVGWCSSSTEGWGGSGHWGALAVDPSSQGRGIASALVKAAEKRLLDAGCRSVQIEYRFIIGDEAKERLYAWYEGKLGFDGGPRRSGFRVCHKILSVESFRAQHENT